MKQSLIILMIIFLIAACSTDKSPVKSTVHPEGWTVLGSDNFHAEKIKQVGYHNCQSCHGADLKGGKSGVACYQANCHASYPIPQGAKAIRNPNGR